MARLIQAIVVLMIMGLVIVPVFADDGQVAFPTIPKAESGPCVGEPAFMRENHMNLLKHDRDVSVQEGNRDVDYSLKECVACHVVRDDVGAPVSVDSPDHFCSSCHQYVAVKIDCFSCHNSKPDEVATISMLNPHPRTATLEQSQISWPTTMLKGQADD